MPKDEELKQPTASEIVAEYARTFIGLGSNLEPRLEYLQAAIAALKNFGEVVRLSSVYETEPVGGIPQPPYLNAVVEFQTLLGPIDLGNHLKALERTLGRKERPRWHEREIDLDLLFYEDLILESPDLTLPHPELHRRAFVLVPLCEVAPDFEHPVLHRSISELTKTVSTQGVRKTDLKL